MNVTPNQIKVLTAALAGAGLGWFIGSVVVEVIHQKKEQRLLPEYYTTNEEGNTVMITDEKAKATASNDRVDYTIHYSTQARPELKDLMKKYEEEDKTESIRDVEPRTEEEIEELHDEDDADYDFDDPDDIDPVVITASQYQQDSDHAHVVLHWFDDEVMTDAKGNAINRFENIVGEEAVLSFGILSEDDDRVYIRNSEKKAMYEIIRQNCDFVASSRIVKRNIFKDNGEEDDNSK